MKIEVKAREGQEGWKETSLRLFSSERCGSPLGGTNEGQVKSRSFDRRKYRIQSGKLPRSLMRATGRRKQPLLVGTWFVHSMAGTVSVPSHSPPCYVGPND